MSAESTALGSKSSLETAKESTLLVNQKNSGCVENGFSCTFPRRVDSQWIRLRLFHLTAMRTNDAAQLRGVALEARGFRSIANSSRGLPEHIEDLY